MKLMKEFVDHLECPSVNGIIFPDGKIQLFNIEVDWAVPITYKLSYGTKTSVGELAKEGELSWNSCVIMTTLSSPDHAIEVIAGEGNYGSDGFVAVLDFKSRELIWIAFFLCSNPFDEVKIVDDQIIATSTLNCNWRFPLKAPADLSVNCFA